MTSKSRCKRLVWKRDTYRLQRGRGFKMRYRSEQCSRVTAEGDDQCWQHARERDRFGIAGLMAHALESC
jgi:hypothetical protein